MSEDVETKLECASCREDLDESDAMSAEIDGELVDVCDGCYYDMTHECTLCNDRFDDSDISEFIVVKSELGATCDRPPGVYRVISKPFLSIPLVGGGSMWSGGVRFVDKLPMPDAEFDISGHVCNKCAKSYEETFKQVYGEGLQQPFSDFQWQREREHTRKVMLANTEMLRDLECDSVDSMPDGAGLHYANANNWRAIKKTYDLPDLPTFHEWLFVEHHGVKVFETCQNEGLYVGWLSVAPEPRFRYGAGSLPETFSASGLPTHVPYDFEQQYYHSKRDAMSAVKSAIEKGFIRQGGTYDAEGNPHRYG